MAYIQSFKEQTWLLPPSIEDLMPEDHVCFLIDSLVDALDYGSFDIKYSGSSGTDGSARTGWLSKTSS